MDELRNKLINVAMEWEQTVGIIPNITTAISEYDASILVGCSFTEFSHCLKNITAVNKGYDFIYNNKKYQVKACRPSGKKGSTITNVPKVKNYQWDYLIWIIYDKYFNIQEAWLWNKEDYENIFYDVKRISPKDMRSGKDLLKDKIKNK